MNVPKICGNFREKCGILEEEILNHFCPIFKKFFKLNLFA
jgi:hypothetical protein